MNIPEFFLLQYNELTLEVLPRFWGTLTSQQMKHRPDPKLNTIVWNLFHITRVEDIVTNRLVAEQSQVWDDPSWGGKLGVSIRHQCTGMTSEEVDELSQQINVDALKEYRMAVTGRTGEIVRNLDEKTLDGTLSADYVRWVVVDQGMAHPNVDVDRMVDGLVKSSRGNNLLFSALTHSYLHVGEIKCLTSKI